MITKVTQTCIALWFIFFVPPVSHESMRMAWFLFGPKCRVWCLFGGAQSIKHKPPVKTQDLCKFSVGLSILLAREILMIFNMLKFHSIFLLPNIECLEHFIAEWNQCFSRISLYRFYWACHFRSARDLYWHCSPLYELLTWNCWRTWIATNCWLGMWPCYIRYMRMPPCFVAIECYKRRKTLINTWAPSL